MIDDKIQLVIRRINQARGEDLYNNLVLALASAVNADYVFIAKIDQNTSQTLALAAHHKLADNFSYNLTDTPCADVTDNTVCIYASDVCKAFPHDALLIDIGIEAYVGVPLHNNQGKVLGILVALFEQPINNTHDIENLFQLFTGLIGGYMERQSQRHDLELQQKLLNSTTEAIAQIDTDGKILFANQAFFELCQIDAGDYLSEILEFSEATVPSFQQKGTWRTQAILSKEQRQHHLILEASDITQNYRVLCLSDITELKLQEKKLYYQANYDSLTSAANRNLFYERLESAISSHQSIASQFALILIDLDNFKQINKRHGSDAGDRALIHTAHTLKSCLKGVDILARIGSNEFAIIANSIHSEREAEQLQHLIFNEIHRDFDHNHLSIPLSACMGMAIFPYDATDSERLYHHADTALRKAKNQGYGNKVRFNQALQDELDRIEYLREAMALGIRRGEFSCHYQPIVCLKTGEIRKLEALLRWQHNGQWISPSEFIPIAEEYELIRPLGEQALKLICLDSQWLQSEYYQPVQISFNRSSQELPKENEAPPNWLSIIEHYRLKPHLFNLEITESILSPSNSVESDYLSQLRKAGIRLSIDDFGTGYSSLNYLRRFHADFLKIDRSFIHDLSSSDGDIVLVSTMISMAKSLGMKVVAEGIEKKADAHQLQEMGCDYGQGFLFAKPMPISDIPSCIRDFKAQKFGLKIH